MKKIQLPLLLAVLLAVGCTTDQKQSKTLSVSIEPLRHIIEQITGNDFEINVLVPPGAGPETYEPTPSQMRTVANSLAYIHTGLLDFEQNLTRSIRQNMPDVELIDLSENIDLISGECGHDHGDAEGKGNEHAPHNDSAEETEHAHNGTDPHIWSSPRSVRQMAKTLYEHVAQMYPDSVQYKTNYEHFTARLDTLDRQLQDLFSGRKISFMIYHPALTYLARDYGLHQIPLEFEGKEPSVVYIRQLIDTAREQGIEQIFYQNQFSKSTVEALSRELNIEAVAIDPLATNVEENILSISKRIAD